MSLELITPSSLKKMSGVQARTEGIYASSYASTISKSMKNDLGLTLFPGSQNQLEGEQRQAFKRSSDCLGSWTLPFPKKRRLNGSTKHNNPIPSGTSSLEFSSFQPTTTSDRAIRFEGFKPKARAHSESLLSLSQRYGKSRSSIALHTMPNLTIPQWSTSVGNKSLDDPIAQQLWPSAPPEAEALLRSFTQSSPPPMAPKVSGEDAGFLTNPSQWSRPMDSTHILSNHMQDNGIMGRCTTYLTNGKSQSDTERAGYETLLYENKILRTEVDLLSGKLKDQKNHYSEVLLEYSRKEHSYQKQRHHVQRLEEEVIAVREALSASLALVTGYKKVNSDLQNRLEKSAILPQSREQPARNVTSNDLSIGGASHNHIIQNVAPPPKNIQGSFDPYLPANYSQQNQWTGPSNPVNSIFHDTTSFDGLLTQENLLDYPQPMDISTAEYDPFPSPLAANYEQPLATCTVGHHPSSGQYSTNYPPDSGVQACRTDANIAETSPPIRISGSSAHPAANLSLDDLQHLTQTTDIVNNKKSTAGTVIDLTNDDLQTYQPPDITASSPSLIQEPFDQAGAIFNHKAKDFAWLEGPHPLRGQAHNAQRKIQQAAAKQRCLPLPDPNSVAPDYSQKKAKNQKNGSPARAQKKIKRNSEHARQPKNCKQTRQAKEATIEDTTSLSEPKSVKIQGASNDRRKVGPRNVDKEIQALAKTIQGQTGRDSVNQPGDFGDPAGQTRTAFSNFENPVGPEVVASAITPCAPAQSQYSNAAGFPYSSSNNGASSGNNEIPATSEIGPIQNTAPLFRNSNSEDDDTDSLFNDPIDEAIDGIELEDSAMEGDGLEETQKSDEIDEDFITDMQNRMIASQEEEEAAQVAGVILQDEESEESEEE